MQCMLSTIPIENKTVRAHKEVEPYEGQMMINSEDFCKNNSKY